MYNEEPREPHRTETSIFQRQKTCHYIYSRVLTFFCYSVNLPYGLGSSISARCNIMNDRQTSLFILSSTWALAFSDSKPLELEVGSGRKRSSRARVLGFSRAFRDHGMCFIWNESWMSHTREGYTTTCLYLWRTFLSFRCFNLLFSTTKNSQFSAQSSVD